MFKLRGVVLGYRLGLFIAPVLVIGLVVLLTIVLGPRDEVQAWGINFEYIGTSPDCTQATFRLTWNNMGVGQTRLGHVSFSDPGPTGITIDPITGLQCNAAGVPYCTGSGTVDFTQSINGGSGYSSASSVPMQFTLHNDSAYVFFGPPYSIPGNSSQTFSFNLDPCGGGGGGGGSSALASLPPLDPPGSPPRVWGGWDHPSSPLVIYHLPYGYQFYHSTGVALGLVDLNAVGIPGPRGLITSMSSGPWRVDLYYIDGDRLQANLYENGVLVEEAWFEVAGIGARAGEVPGQPAPSAPGGGAGGGGVAVVEHTGGGAVQVMCRQNLRQWASIETPVLYVMEPGTTISVVGRSNDGSWLEVVTPNGLRGWAFNGRCINAGAQTYQQAPVEVVFESQPTVTDGGQAVAQQQAPAPVTVSAPAGSPVVGVVCRQNLRSGPGTGFTVSRVLEPGATLGVVGRSDDGSWLQVSAPGADGWLYFGRCVLPQQGDVTAAPVTVAFGG